MRRFCELYFELDQTTRTSEKVAALRRYFLEAEPRDAAWALHVLSGGKLIRAVPHRLLRQWAAEVSGYPMWLIDECYPPVGDLSEVLALILPAPPHADGEGTAEPLHQVIEQHVLPLPKLDEASRRQKVVQVWSRTDERQKFLFHKLILGEFRVGVARTLVIRAAAEAAGVEPAVMAHRLSGTWSPTEAEFRRIMSSGGGEVDPARPYPFYLAYPLDIAPEELGEIGDWHIEWKWDGIRAQLIHRAEDALVWSRGEELLTPGFPEIETVGRSLLGGTVLDGEIVAWEHERPMTFGMLQRRIHRKKVEPRLFPEVPVTFIAYDLLEHEGRDVREQPLSQRRQMLEAIVAATRGIDEQLPLRISPAVDVASWADLVERMNEARERGVEGFMIKRLDSPYGVGRQRGQWWKWKVDPYSIDAVLIFAAHGHGVRAGIFTDYTFGVWSGGELVPVAKAYSGLTKAEIAEVDRFIRRHTIQRFGSVHQVEPRLVFEIGFENIRRSTRHKSGVAVRFPRMLRWRRDKTPEEADALDTLQSLLADIEGRT